MQDILTFIITREGLRRPKPMRPSVADQQFYDTAAPFAVTLHAARQRLARWRHRQPRREMAGD
ncbi:hypothetical protein CXZ10_06660 [Pleomorphomonas diazotrophica]|uniref:Uncharacterized protein n=1 Tax=Pleomorphomonas diazotrophica TaxID=1166257 RepID=A0A1I4WLZ8_9HYPH|nr:hypothetical protein [Pleomorphomonas diazotrophica]PKR91017.1 hypothetical protein CXZ10_06660 [Pleomorphomonas diazotrophica]SFN14233.1 hypothetical protein SAMN05192571_11825 [Pleomorphomonas diazotrophica]